MRLTRRTFLECAGSFATALALAACSGGAADSSSGSGEGEAAEQAEATAAAPAVTPPDEREFWVCTSRTYHGEKTEVDQETGKEATTVRDSHWTATLDNHGNVVSVEGDEDGDSRSIHMEVNEDGLLTHLDDSFNSQHAFDVSYECDDEGRPAKCSVTAAEGSMAGTERYTLAITYNDLGDIAAYSYDDGSGNAMAEELDEYGVETLRHGSDERNKRGLPTHSSHNMGMSGGVYGPEEESYEYDDAGNLIRYTYTYEGAVDSEVVCKEKREVSFEYERVEDPSLAVRLGSHLWGCRSSVNDLFGHEAYEQSSEISPAWGF